MAPEFELESVMTLRPANIIVATALMGLVSQAGAAAAQDKPPERAAALKAVTDCRQITEPTSRLACFDQTTAALDAAESRGEVVVVDKAQMKDARRAAFGFTFKMPEFMTRGVETEEVGRLEATVAEAYQSGGKWVITLDDGAVWRQIDATRLRKDPKAGSKAEIKTAMMGSFMMKIDGQLAMRVHRDR